MNALKKAAEQLENSLRAELPEFGIWVDWDYFPPDAEFGLQVYFDIKIKREIGGDVRIANMQVLSGDNNEPVIPVPEIVQTIQEQWERTEVPL